MLESLQYELQTQWQSSQVLRLGAWGIVLILLLYLVLWLDDSLALRQLEWHRQAVAVADMKAMQQQDYWPKVVHKLEQQHEQLLDDTWQAETAGLAKASVREFITRSTAEASRPIELRQTEFAEPQPLTEDVREMRGRVTAALDGRTVPWQWIAALETHTPAFIVDALDVRVGQRSGIRVIIEFRTPLTGLEPPR